MHPGFNPFLQETRGVVVFHAVCLRPRGSIESTHFPKSGSGSS